MSDENLIEKVLPRQRTGWKSSTSSHVDVHTATYARSLFKEVSGRLLEVNHWQHFAGAATAHFQLVDATGSEVFRQVRQGDYFEIDIPGPGNRSGGGKDWVQVEKIGHETGEDEDLVYLTVRSAAHPLKLSSESDHFFSKQATSTFFVHRKNLRLTAGVLGKNESPNKNTPNLLDRLRNIAVAFGAFLGFSSVQWKALTKGLLRQQAKGDK